MTENEYQQRIVQLEREVADLKAKLTAKQKATRYGLVWEDVPEAFEHEAENKIPILEEVKDKAIKNDDGKPTHILIEGDNYHALQCLNYTHRGKVDVIYIDPPYNTGSDGFTYKDKRFLKEFPDGTSVPKDHPLRHSYWLSF
ncbi:MAG: site-specific DNA-methyltransferase, partial [Bacteroidales bacterium]|nr:site-specific DNA-methyltransferase [Bacteroidales bacterium]